MSALTIEDVVGLSDLIRSASAQLGVQSGAHHHIDKVYIHVPSGTIEQRNSSGIYQKINELENNGKPVWHKSSDNLPSPLPKKKMNIQSNDDGSRWLYFDTLGNWMVTFYKEDIKSNAGFLKSSQEHADTPPAVTAGSWKRYDSEGKQWVEDASIMVQADPLQACPFVVDAAIAKEQELHALSRVIHDMAMQLGVHFVPDMLHVHVPTGTTLQKGSTGIYQKIFDPEHKGKPVWCKSGDGGRRFLYLHPRGIWVVANDESDMANNVGYLQSSREHVGSPSGVTGWKRYEGDTKQWVEDASITVRADPLLACPLVVNAAIAKEAELHTLSRALHDMAAQLGVQFAIDNLYLHVPNGTSFQQYSTGVYQKDGEHNGKPVWVKSGDGGDRWLFCNAPGSWKVTPFKSDIEKGLGFLRSAGNIVDAPPTMTAGGWERSDMDTKQWLEDAAITVRANIVKECALVVNAAAEQDKELIRLRAEFGELKNAKENAKAELERTRIDAGSKTEEQERELARLCAEVGDLKRWKHSAETEKLKISTELEQARIDAVSKSREQGEELARLSAEVGELKKGKDDAEAEKLKTSTELQQARIDATSQNEEHDKELALLRAELSEAKKAKELAEEENLRMSSELEQVRTDAAPKNEELDMEFERLRAEVGELKNAKEDAEAEKLKISTELEQTRSDAAAKNLEQDTELAQLRAKVEQLQSDLLGELRGANATAVDVM